MIPCLDAGSTPASSTFAHRSPAIERDEGELRSWKCCSLRKIGSVSFGGVSSLKPWRKRRLSSFVNTPEIITKLRWCFFVEALAKAKTLHPFFNDSLYRSSVQTEHRNRNLWNWEPISQSILDESYIYQMDTWIVCILECNDKTFYVGRTSNLEKRLVRHNRGEVSYTSTRLPLVVKTFTTFHDKYLAYNFEKYLKSGSGRAFMYKRLVNKNL